MSGQRGTIECIHLVHADETGTTTAIVVPAWGANVIALAHQRADWVWPLPVLESVDMASIALKPSSYGMPLLAPTPGRVGRDQDGCFRYAGHDYRITPTRHGYLRNRPWRVRDAQTDTVSCECEVDLVAEGAARESFPYRLLATHTVELLAGRLRSTLALTNTGDARAPVNAGWHPYLHRSPGPCIVCLPAARQWVLDDAREATPTGELAPADEAFMRGRLLQADEHWDQIFTSLATDDEGRVTCWVEQPEAVTSSAGPTDTLRIRRFVRVDVAAAHGGQHPVRHMQLYTPPGRAAISLEPLSSTPNAINLAANGHPGTDLCELAPGQRVEFRIEVGMQTVD